MLSNKSLVEFMMRGLIILVAVGFLLKACEVRPLPELQQGDIRFFVKGQLGQDFVNKEAGQENQFLYTGSKAEDGVKIFWGKFGLASCENCPDNIEIQIRDLDVELLADALHMDSLLKVGPRNYFVEGGVEGRKRRRVSFTNQSKGKANPTYKWDFGDGTTFIGKDPVHEYIDPEISTATVCLETVEPDGCTSVICNEIQLEDSSCVVDFSHTLLPNSTYVKFDAQVMGTPPFKYTWTFGDGGTASLGNPGYFYPVPGKYEACLMVEDGRGCISTICKNIAADPTLCEHNFAYRLGASPTKDFLQFGRFEIIYTDPNGKEYSSSLNEQPSTSNFEILEREPYKKNRKGENTYSFRCSFNCKLWDELGNELDLQNGLSAAAVAYP